MTKEEKMLAAFSNILYVNEGIRVSPTDLKSTNAKKVLSEEILDKIKEYEPYFNKIEEVVTFIDDIRNPTGVYKFMRDYALNNGTQYRKTVTFTNNNTGKTYDKEIDDFYEADDPEEYVMCIIDHISLVSQEVEEGKMMSLHQSIVKLSSRYLVGIRNKYNHIPVVVQQQSSASEGMEFAKENKLKPSLSDLGDCKLTQRDANMILGLFSPFRHEIRTYRGYDIERFRDNIRFMEILGSREGGGNTVCPLYFDGAVNYFKELPRADNHSAMQKVYKTLDTMRK